MHKARVPPGRDGCVGKPSVTGENRRAALSERRGCFIEVAAGKERGIPHLNVVQAGLDGGLLGTVHDVFDPLDNQRWICGNGSGEFAPPDRKSVV